MKTPKQTLAAARAIIADPKHWTQHRIARNESGNPVDYIDDRACQWCATGALALVSDRGEYMVAYEKLKPFTYSGDVPEFNDTHTHDEVLEMFDKAIAACG